MSKFTLHIENSFCRLSGNIPSIVDDSLTRVLTYQNDIQGEKNAIFGQMQMAKRFNNKKKYDQLVFKLKQLEASEWVCWYRHQTFPTGHLNIVSDVLKALNIQYLIEDQRPKPKAYLDLSWANTPFAPRYYQKDVIDLCLTNGRGVIESAVGTGKSLMMTYIIKELRVRSLIVVPSRGLLEQMSRDLTIHFGSDRVQTIDSATVRKGKCLKDIRVITIQSMAALQKSGDLQMLVSDIDALYLDEIHHAGSASYTNLLPEISHIFYRFGFSGSFMRNDSKSLDMWGFLSNVLYKYSAKQATDEGFLTPAKIYWHTINGKKNNKYQKEYDLNYCGNPELLEVILSLCILHRGSQILILVDKKEKGGKIFYDYLSTAGLVVSYISGDDTKEVIGNTITKFNEKSIQLLIGSNVIGEGIDLCSTDHLIMAQGGKSEVKFTQAIGRAIRLFPGKVIAHIHDFVFTNTKYLNKHSDLRKNIYDRLL